MNLNWPKSFLYVVAILSSLSSAGASMSLLALSSEFFTESANGYASSAIYTAYYLGIGSIGIIGGGILQRYSSAFLGITGPLISAIIVFCLAGIDHLSPFIGLPIIYLIFLLNGIDHPNNLRFFNEVLPENEKMSFFSVTEGLTAIFSIASPVLAGIIISLYGIKTCFIIDGCTYLISCLPWLIVGQYNKQNKDLKPKINWLIGFKTIYQNIDVRSLTVVDYLLILHMYFLQQQFL
jgi:MFS family permease